MISPYVLPGMKIGKAPTTASMKAVVEVLEHRYGYTLAAMKQKDRSYELTYVRHLSMYILRQKGFTFSCIGKYFDRDHTSIIHAVKSIQNYIETNEEKKEEVAEVLRLTQFYRLNNAA